MIDRHTKTDRQADRQTKTDRHADRHTERQDDEVTGRETDEGDNV